ncbi:hypothetical protein VPH35_097444 [Triticum aestivum]
MAWLVFFLLCVRSMALGLAATLAKCCGGGGVKLLGWCCPILDGVVRCDARMKILHGFRRAGGDGTRGCHSPPWRRRHGVLVTSLTCLELWLSPGESLDRLDRHNGGVFDVVPLLGALCLETWPAPRSSPPVFAAVLLDPLRRYVRPLPVCPRWCLSQIGSSPTTHLPLSLRR